MNLELNWEEDLLLVGHSIWCATFSTPPCHLVSPEKLIQLVRPIFMMNLNGICEYGLKYLIGGLNLSVFLWNVWIGSLMPNLIPLHNRLDNFGCELCSSVHDDLPRNIKSTEDLFIKEINNFLFISLNQQLCLNPFCDVISATKIYFFFIDIGVIKPTKSQANFLKGSINTYRCSGISFA